MDNYSIKIEKNLKLDCYIAYFSKANFIIDSGYKFDEFKIAYKTYGKLNSNKNNVRYFFIIVKRLILRSLKLFY